MAVMAARGGFAHLTRQGTVRLGRETSDGRRRNGKLMTPAHQKET
jgi:hypothetical protein